MSSHLDIISMWPTTAEFASDLGITASHARVMKARGSIPPEHWPSVVRTAAVRGYPDVTLERLATARAHKAVGRETAA